ncbi:MAG TPA: hypothetical protein DHV26_04885, partial [Cytophagales bacterium]|nr:hypothetical protein [Cytophagales bacterium]
PAFVFPGNLWYVPGVSYLVGFPIIKWLVNQTAWGKRIAKKFEEGGGSGGSGGSWSSGSSWGSSSSSSWSSSGSSFSGGGGSFGGGGSSGSW